MSTSEICTLKMQKMMGWQWHQLDHMHIICSLLHTDNYASRSSLDSLQADALPIKATAPYLKLTINIFLDEDFCLTLPWQTSNYQISPEKWLPWAKCKMSLTETCANWKLKMPCRLDVSNGVCLENNRDNYQNCSFQCIIHNLYKTVWRHLYAVLKLAV